MVLVAVGLACQMAQSGDRRSSGGGQETKAILVAPETSAAFANGRRGSSAVGFFETGYSNHCSSRGEGHTSASARERKALTLFRMNSKCGEIAVQPVIGKVNGAQFSLGF